MGLYYSKKYNFKTERCDELENFDIPFAVKEYLQNTTGQILKALEVRKWREWERTDLSANSIDSQVKREKMKARLLRNDPGLFAGFQGKAIAKAKSCQPLYVLETTIPRNEIRKNQREHDLRAVIILWGFIDTATGLHGGAALTVYNNYLDPETRFSHFVHDGASTSKGNRWAVGLKGKGFILCTSYLAQVCDRQVVKSPLLGNRLGISSKAFGVGFNVGSRFCKTEFNKASPRMLKVKKEDFRALTLEEFKKENPKGSFKDIESDDDTSSEGEDRLSNLARHSFPARGDVFYADRIAKTHKKREELCITEKIPKKEGQKYAQGRTFVREDDVCIHVIGLPAELTAQKVFSAVFGIFPEKKVWRIPGTLFEFFESQGHRGRFYHRDQLVPVPNPLGSLGLNYHGDLSLSSDRMEIIKKRRYDEYEENLTKALEIAISTIPELAVLIMNNMLCQDRRTAESLRNLLKPSIKDYGAEWKQAFESAHGDRAQPIYPFARRAKGEALIREFGFEPIPLEDWQMRVLEDAGAYESIERHAESHLENAPEIMDLEPSGMTLLSECVRDLIPEIEGNVSIRDHSYSFPRVLHKDGRILVTQPRTCDKCPKGQCSCWVRPALVRIMLDKDKDADLDAIFWVYDRLEKAANGKEHVSMDADAEKPSLGTSEGSDGVLVSIAGTLEPGYFRDDSEDEVPDHAISYQTHNAREPTLLSLLTGTLWPRNSNAGRPSMLRKAANTRNSMRMSESNSLPSPPELEADYSMPHWISVPPNPSTESSSPFSSDMGGVELTETEEKIHLEIAKKVKKSGEEALDTFRARLRSKAVASARAIDELAKAEAEMVTGLRSLQVNDGVGETPGGKRRRRN